jgi:transcriptional regulator with XRE-family HTH domain
MVDKEELGKRVTRARERRRLSVQDLADLSQVSYQNVWRIEHGQQGKPNVFLIGRLCLALGVTIEQLVGLYEEEKDSEIQPAAAAMV